MMWAEPTLVGPRFGSNKLVRGWPNKLGPITAQNRGWADFSPTNSIFYFFLFRFFPSLSYFLFFFHSFFFFCSHHPPFFSPSSPRGEGVFIRGRGARVTLPLSSHGDEVGWLGRPLCNHPRVAWRACLPCPFHHGGRS